MGRILRDSSLVFRQCKGGGLTSWDGMGIRAAVEARTELENNSYHYGILWLRIAL